MFISLSLCVLCSVVSTGGENLEQAVSTLWWRCFQNLEMNGLLNDRQVNSDDFLCSRDCPVSSCSVRRLIANQTAGFAEHRPDVCSVELDQQLLRQVKLPELAKEIHHWAILLTVYVGNPLKVLRKNGSKNLKVQQIQCD